MSMAGSRAVDHGSDDEAEATHGLLQQSGRGRERKDRQDHGDGRNDEAEGDIASPAEVDAQFQQLVVPEQGHERCPDTAEADTGPTGPASYRLQGKRPLVVGLLAFQPSLPAREKQAPSSITCSVKRSGAATAPSSKLMHMHMHMTIVMRHGAAVAGSPLTGSCWRDGRNGDG